MLDALFDHIQQISSNVEIIGILIQRFGSRPVERPSYKFDGIACRPELDAKLSIASFIGIGSNKAAPRCGAVRGGVSRSGVGGAKGGDQGECGPAKHALDSAPGSRVTGAGNACGNCLPFGPEVGAVCGKAARTDLVQRG